MNGLGRIGKNVGLVFSARVFDVLSTVIIVVILTRYVSVETYGKYSFVMALVYTLSSFANIGMPKILIREISQDREAAGNFLGVALIFTGIMSVFVILITNVV